MKLKLQVKHFEKDRYVSRGTAAILDFDIKQKMICTFMLCEHWSVNAASVQIAGSCLLFKLKPKFRFMVVPCRTSFDLRQKQRNIFFVRAVVVSLLNTKHFCAHAAQKRVLFATYKKTNGCICRTCAQDTLIIETAVFIAGNLVNFTFWSTREMYINTFSVINLHTVRFLSQKGL